MKKDERSDRGENAEEERQREGRDDIFHGQLVKGNGEESGKPVVWGQRVVCVCVALRCRGKLVCSSDICA